MNPKPSGKNNSGIKDKPNALSLSAGSSHTQFFKREKPYLPHKRVSRNTFYSIQSETDTSESYGCVEHKKNPEKELKEFIERGYIGDGENVVCYHKQSWEISEKIVFLLEDPVGTLHTERILEMLENLCHVTRNGFHIKILDNITNIMDHLLENKTGIYNKYLKALLMRVQKPIFLDILPDIVDFFANIRDYLGYLGYLLIRIDDPDLFTILSDGLLWQLSAPEKERPSSASLHHTLAAACQVLNHIVNRMILFSSDFKFPTFLTAAYIIVCHSSENAIELMKDKIIEKILYRFSPCFPTQKLPPYEQTVLRGQDLILGDSTKHCLTTFNLMLVLINTALKARREDPTLEFPCPDEESQRCFAWAYRYQCTENEFKQERLTMTVIFTAMLRLYGNKMNTLCHILMSDILTLSVASEVQCHVPWINKVTINTYLIDVQFKKALIGLSVEFLKLWPDYSFLVESTSWLTGLMYLIDPELCKLRTNWSTSLFTEIRNVVLQSLVCVLPLVKTDLVLEIAITRRILWYIEWYTINPYSLSTLFWCIRVVQLSLFKSDSPARKDSVRNLFESHGIIIIIHLCSNLMGEPLPPSFKCQIALDFCLRIVTNGLIYHKTCTCLVYPDLRWPQLITPFAQRMLRDVVFCLTQNYHIFDRLMISLLNFIWEGVIWNEENRKTFVKENGIYKLLDMITMVSAPVQTIALAIICDILRSGIGIGQIVTWRACFGASNAVPVLVNRGATICSLLAKIFCDDCKVSGIDLTETGLILEGENNPLMTKSVRNLMEQPFTKIGLSKRTSECYTASDIAGSRMSKVFAILHMMSHELEFHVHIADETYNLYQNVKLNEHDEVILVLCSNYMTFKIFEVWTEVARICSHAQIVNIDEDVIDDFQKMNKSWIEHIRHVQAEIIERYHKKDVIKEISLHDFLGRVRLHVALEALTEIRRVQRCSNKDHLNKTLIKDAIEAQYRCDYVNKKLNTILHKTYAPLLDEENITGQHVKVNSLKIKKKNVL